MQKNVLEYLERTVRRLPEKVAFVDENESISFRRLTDEARSMGTFLARQTMVRNRPVVVLADRTALSVTGFAAALYSGNFYVPLDPQMPRQRLAAILEQLSPAALIFHPGDRTLIDDITYNCLYLELGAEYGPADDALIQTIRRQQLDVDPVYAIFTSGSTGEPKGIVVSHRSVIDFVDWYVNEMGITESDRLGNQAPFYFDLSVKNLYPTFCQGSTTYLLPKKFFSFPILLTRYLNENQITVLSWATSAFHLIANSGVLEKSPPTQLVRLVIVGGEALQAKQLNRWRAALPKAQFVNLYGPTEVTVDCTYYKIDRDFDDEEPIPIGWACDNKEVLLLDKEGRSVTPGEPGELCVRGSGLAQGYFGDWDKTRGSFTQNPLNPWYPDLIYHTGDIAVQSPDGSFRFLSRKDSQVKHLGYRVELGEIETALNAIPSVQQAVCLFDTRSDKIHCCYTGGENENGLARAARAALPRYMVPNIYHKLGELPYNPNGKIDRSRLQKEFLDGTD